MNDEELEVRHFVRVETDRPVKVSGASWTSLHEESQSQCGHLSGPTRPHGNHH
jgi:hypothetical protein